MGQPDELYLEHWMMVPIYMEHKSKRSMGKVLNSKK